MRIPIVDENDEVIEYKEKEEVSAKDIFRVAGLWVKDANGKLLLARRAYTKKHDPGKWSLAVVGTVEEGETYESNILKEAYEELGLTNIKPEIASKARVSQKELNIFCQFFFITLPIGFNDFVLSEREVAEVRWFTRDELESDRSKNPQEFIPSFQYNMDALEQYENSNR